MTQGAMAAVLSQLGRPQEALALYEESLRTKKALGDTRGVAVTQANFGQFLLQQGEHLRAVAVLWEAYAALQAAGYAADAQTLRELLAAVRAQVLGPEAFDRAWEEAVGQAQPGWLCEPRQEGQGGSAEGGQQLAEEQLRVLAANTVAVMTVVPERRPEWRQAVRELLANAQRAGDEDTAALMQAVLALLDGGEAGLSADSPYYGTWQETLAGLAAGRPPEAADPETAQIMDAIQGFVDAEDWEATRQAVEAHAELLLRPQVEEIFEQNIARAREAGNTRWCGLLAAAPGTAAGLPPRRHRGSLRRIADRGPIRSALRPRLDLADGGGAARLAAGKAGPPPARHVAAGRGPGARPASVPGSHPERAAGRRPGRAGPRAGGDLCPGLAGHRRGRVRRDDGDGHVGRHRQQHAGRAGAGVRAPQRVARRPGTELLNQATAQGDQPMVAFLRAVLALLDAGGKPDGLGQDLAGVYAGVWQAIVDALQGEDS